MKPIEIYNHEQATHYLECKHCIGRNCSYYVMKCIPLHKTESGKVKIILFGERNWKHKEHIKNIRYVDSSRLKPIYTLNANQNK